MGRAGVLMVLFIFSPILISVLFFVFFVFDSPSFEVMGVSMVLVGETLMRAEDPKKAIRALLGKEEPTPVRENSKKLHASKLE